MTINLTVTGTIDTARTDGTDWAALAPALGDRVKVAWMRAEYAMYRADHGQGPVQQGNVIPATGSPWATVCHHGTAHRAKSGANAETAGRNRALWCEHCKAGQAGTLPKVGAVTEPTTTATQAGPSAPADKPTPAPTAKAVEAKPTK